MTHGYGVSGVPFVRAFQTPGFFLFIMLGVVFSVAMGSGATAALNDDVSVSEVRSEYASIGEGTSEYNGDGPQWTYEFRDAVLDAGADVGLYGFNWGVRNPHIGQYLSPVLSGGMLLSTVAFAFWRLKAVRMAP